MTNKIQDVIEIDRTMGSVIGEARKNMKLTQTQLADATGVTFQQIQKYETGKNRVSVSRLFLICDALGVAPTQLIAQIEERLSYGSKHNKEVLVARQKLIKTEKGHRILMNLAELENSDLLDSISILLDKVRDTQ